ncbi:MAG TPA: zinc ABC transporter substrate-binding protein, partial [Deltaproteobacteria bacterium]|nr:zinc ABC transporter substrate-binding protein [Deltaproteobacteria bacterium]
IVARNAQDALIEVFPSMEDSLRAWHERLQQHLIALDDSLRLILHDSIGRSFAIFHPSLTYLAQDYGLTQLSIEHEGKDPSPQQLKAVIDQIRDKEIQAIFVQKEFNQDHARAIAGAVGIPVVVIDPLSADLDLNILRIARQIAHNH